MKRPICVASLAAVTAVAGATHAADAKVPEAREVVSTTAVDVARVPTFELPPPLKDTATAPTGAEATGLQLGSTPGEVEKWRKNPFQAASFLLKGESAAFSVQLAGAQTSLAREALWVSCDAHGRRSFQALRWETLVVDASGQATWSIHDGFLDPKTCRIFYDCTQPLVHAEVG